MPIGGIDGTTAAAASGAATASASESLGQLGGDTFLKLLVAQLRYQNPMQPTDATSMLQQTAQFTQIETLQQLASAQQELLTHHQNSVASSLIGKEVTVAGEDDEDVTGLVDHIKFTPDGPVLCMGELEFPLDAVRETRMPGSTDPSTSA